MTSTETLAAPSAHPPAKGRILVVDDDRLVLATLVHGLAQAGFDVVDADNGDDAILLARQHKPDLALLDIRMDGMSGFDVAAYLREHLRIPFMFLSAFSDEATVNQIKALGALAYLVKPLDVAQIVPAVEAAFAQARERAGLVAPSPAAAPAPVAPLNPLEQHVPMAVGILMHRYSLSPDAALQRLRKLAEREGRAIEASAKAMVQALEQLAAPGDL
ncbi:response regulator receiver and ANTAR domain protein [Sphaerotilus mobilis]|uniref:Response regulator receiver and ANTAR domain protein n=1 Tax=Sphaerotilus mobilis TaxID=47994 RepID=A0A4Q7LSD0_9BURK|nr:response regulator receiver and ANTAR domain protein [Sphaerotilus mobilis]